MGSSSSVLQTYRNALKQVAERTHWREGLLIQVAGAKPLLVYKIHPLDHVHNETELAQLSSGSIQTTIPGLDIETQYVYQYTGNRVSGVEPASGQYAIFLRTLNPAKIGGRSRQTTPMEIPHDYTSAHEVHKLHESHNTTPAVDLLNIDLEQYTKRNFTTNEDPYPDDNIADE